MITLVLGGTRSGKSAVAERLALRNEHPVVYLATGRRTDADMAERIERHRERRDPRFRTVEVGDDLVGALVAHEDRPVLLDALGTWVASRPGLAVEPAVVVAALQARTAPTVVVSDEVGLGVHPSSELGRRFRDVVGELNQAVAAVAGEVLLVVAGRTLRLDDPDGGE